MSDLDNLHDYPSWSDLGCLLIIIAAIVAVGYVAY